MTVLPSGGRSCREGEASSCNVNPEEIKIIIIEKEENSALVAATNQDTQKCEQEGLYHMNSQINQTWIELWQKRTIFISWIVNWVCFHFIFEMRGWCLAFHFIVLAGGILTGNTDSKQVAADWRAPPHTHVTDTHPRKHIWYHRIGHIPLFQCHERQYPILLRV